MADQNQQNVRDQWQNGYADTRSSLETRYDSTLENFRSEQGRDASPAERRQLVKDIAVSESKAIAEDVGDRGRGLERINDPAYDSGSRKAIMDWSREHNHALKNTLDHTHPAVVQHEISAGETGSAQRKQEHFWQVPGGAAAVISEHRIERAEHHQKQRDKQELGYSL